MFEGMKDMAAMMKLMGQAGKIKENIAQAQERARARNTVAEVGGGMVSVTANGLGEIVSIQIDPEALQDHETLGPLLVSATNKAILKSKELLMEETRTAMGGIELPPGLL
jgi:DNA-binding YbaB/EbfC family protein